MQETHSRRGLGSSHYEELDETGPGYAIRARANLSHEDSEATSKQK